MKICIGRDKIQVNRKESNEKFSSYITVIPFMYQLADKKSGDMEQKLLDHLYRFSSK